MAAGFFVLLENEPIGENTYAAKMTTFEYPNAANFLIPKITSGSLYTGSFDMKPGSLFTNVDLVENVHTIRIWKITSCILKSLCFSEGYININLEINI